MKLYDYFRSTTCYRVRIALNLKNLPAEIIPIHLLNNGGEQHHPNYLAHNPQGLVPTLTVGEHDLTQSLAIIEYLEETYPTPALLPKDPILKAKNRALALTIACDIHPLNNLRVLNYLKSQGSFDEEAIQQWYHHWLKAGFDAIESHLSEAPQTPYCHSETPTLADICLTPQVYNANRFQFDLTPYPNIVRINQTAIQNPAFINAMPE